MKIYFATTAPGSELDKGDRKGLLPIKNRLLSFYHLYIDTFYSREALKEIMKHNKKVAQNENIPGGEFSADG